MKFVALTVLMLLTAGCAEKSPKEGESFVEAVTDLAIRLKNNEPIELSTLYDSLVSKIPTDSNETFLLADQLKRKGFKIVNGGRGNFPPNGIRIVSLTLQKDQCECTVNKMYYRTIVDDLYQIRESISCTNP